MQKPNRKNRVLRNDRNLQGSNPVVGVAGKKVVGTPFDPEIGSCLDMKMRYNASVFSIQHYLKSLITQSL